MDIKVVLDRDEISEVDKRGKITFVPEAYHEDPREVDRSLFHEYLHTILSEETNIGTGGQGWFEQENLLTFFLEEALDPDSHLSLKEHLDNLNYWFTHQYPHGFEVKGKVKPYQMKK